MSLIVDNLFLSSISEIRNNADMMRKTSLHINAAEEVDYKFVSNSLTRIDLNWSDSPMQNVNENAILIHLVKMMDTYLSCGKQVLVNCFAGISRSATIVIAYLMYKNKWGLEDAVSFVRSKRYFINPNYGFLYQLYNLQDTLCHLDERYDEYMKNFQNKTQAQLKEEIDINYKNPIILKLIPTPSGYNDPNYDTTSSVYFPPTYNFLSSVTSLTEID